jgi:hypothetical protein
MANYWDVTGTPVYLREQFEQLFEVKIERAPFDDDVGQELLKASEIACRGVNFFGYIIDSLEEVDLVFILRFRRTGQIVSFATALLRVDIPVAVLSLICAKSDEKVSYGIVMHGIVGAELTRLGITEVVLSSVNDTEKYYEYLGYKRALTDASGRAIARTTDGAPMVMNDIRDSNLVKIFPQKLEKLVGVVQSFGIALPIQGQIKQTSEWQSLSQIWQHSLRHASEVSLDELIWGYASPPEDIEITESFWAFECSRADKARILKESDWISAFKLNKATVTVPHAFVLAKEHGDVVELFPWVTREINGKSTTIPQSLLMVAALLMLRFFRAKGFKKAFVINFPLWLLKRMGFREREAWETLIVPTTKDLYAINLQSADLKKTTSELVKLAWNTQQHFMPNAITADDMLPETLPVSITEFVGKALKAVYELPRNYILLDGKILVETRWSTTKMSAGKTLVDSPVLNAHMYLQDDGWPLASMSQIILKRLKVAVKGDSQFSPIFPAIGYFNIVYEVEPLAEDASLDLRMSAFYSALALLPRQQPELRGFMATALGAVLTSEIQRGTISPNMTFGLEASGNLGSKNMMGLVNYYRSKLGLQVARPNSLEADIEEGAVIMLAPLSKVLDTIEER